MSDIAIDDLPDSQPPLEPYQPPKPLAELYPDEIRFYASRFIWSSNRSGFYTRTGYEKENGWHARKRLGVEWMPLYPALVAELIEKHLDFDRFCLNADWMSPNRPKDDESAFWLGTMAGKYTYYDCIDVDVHDRVGFYGKPTRWHPERNRCGSLWHPYVYRMMPVVRLGIDYFKKLKLFHEYCPGRVLVVQFGQPGDESLPHVTEGGMSEGAIPEGQGSAESHAHGCPGRGAHRSVP